MRAAMAERKPAKKAAARRAPDAPVEKTPVLFPKTLYDANKDAIKAPFKAQGMKWAFLGEGKGLYKRPDGGVHCFVQFQDDGVHYALWGEDKAAVDALLATWRGILGDTGLEKAMTQGVAAEAAEEAKAESEAMKLWRLGEPHPRPGEPDFFFKKRRAEWEAKKPGA